jgi:hypothetical protein
MDTTTAIALTIIVFAALGVLAYVYFTEQKTKRLRSRFGPEYSRTIEETGDRRRAEERLEKRAKRVEALSIHPLRPEERERYVASWRRIQTEFVDNPKSAVTRADELLGEVMAAQGYPMSDFDQRSADLSVEHPVVVQNYRAAHDIALRHRKGDATTEDLRQAMIHYRTLFNELAAPELARAHH